MDLSKDLLEHFKLETEILPDCTTHTSYKSDRKRGLRKVKVVKRWIKRQNIGVGNFGSVWLEVENDGSERAVKKVSKSLCTLNNIDYEKELAAMAVLSRYEEVFVQFHGWYEDLENVYMAMEYFSLGDLQSYVDAMDSRIPEPEVKTIVLQLLEGLKFMHDNHFTHRDLKPQNIFVVEELPSFWVKIGDFGIAKRITHDGTFLRTETGTRGYLAPEVLGYVDEEASRYTNAVDLWALGCVCHRLLAMEPPFEKQTALARYCYDGTGLPIETMYPGVVSAEGVKFLKSLLMAQPSERLTAEAAMSSLWLSQCNKAEVEISIDTLALRPKHVNDEHWKIQEIAINDVLRNLPSESQKSSQHQLATTKAVAVEIEDESEEYLRKKKLHLRLQQRAPMLKILLPR